MPKCRLCGNHLRMITNTHLRAKHSLTVGEYMRRFPGVDLGMPAFPSRLGRDDPKYLVWRKSLLGKSPWNKGLNKECDETVKRISLALTGRSRKKVEGNSTPPLRPSAALAELTGVVLGDGHLRKCERTEQLCISCNSNQLNYIDHITELVRVVLRKTPSIYRSKSENTVRIALYQNGLSERLGLPHGNKIRNNVGVPDWIKNDGTYFIKCLKGLFETDGSLSVHQKSYTTAIEFKNECTRLLEDVYAALSSFGFAPQKGKNYIRLARKKEVRKFVDLIAFRSWPADVL